MRVGRKAAGGTRRAVLGPCPSEDGGGPRSLPSSPERTECRLHVEGARRGRENEEGFQRFEAESAKTAHQSLFRRHRAFATKPFTRTWRREEDPRRRAPAVEAIQA